MLKRELRLNHERMKTISMCVLISENRFIADHVRSTREGYIFTYRIHSTMGGYVLTGVCLLTPWGGGYPSQVQLGGGCPSQVHIGVPKMGYPWQGWGTPQSGQDGGGGDYPRWAQPAQDWGVPDMGYPLAGMGYNPPKRTADVLDTPRSVCLLRSRRIKKYNV